jgi:hypothetical protein
MWAVHHGMEHSFDFPYKPILPLKTAELVCTIGNTLIIDHTYKYDSDQSTEE